MNQANFSYYDINLTKGYTSNEIYVTGEIKNNSTVNYSTVLFRVLLYVQNKVEASGTLKIAGLPAKGNKSFEAKVEGLHEMDERTMSRITRCEILFESGY